MCSICGVNNIHLPMVDLFTKDEVTDILNYIKIGAITTDNLYFDLYKLTAIRLMESVTKGFNGDINQYDKLSDLTENIYAFSAAKQYQFLREINKVDIDIEGLNVYNKYYQDYLATEIDTAEQSGISIKFWNDL